MAIFSLNEVRTEQIKNIANDNFESWPESATYGYFGGGMESNPPGGIPGKVEKLDFSTETCSLPSNKLSKARRSLAAVSSNSYGYFGGGYENRPDLSPSFNVLDTIDRLDFSNETTSLPGNNLPERRYGLEAVSSSSYGYFAGGGGFSPPTGLIDRIDFSNETTSAPGNNLPLNTWSTSAVSSGSYGYFGGGKSFSPPPPTRTISATVDRLDFSSETFSAPGNNLSQARELLSAVSNSSYGYFGGGIDYNPNPITYFDRIDRIDFSNETTSEPGNNLPVRLSDGAATSSSSYGYFGGGYVGPPIDDSVDTIYRIDFSNETVTASTQLVEENYRQAAVSGGASQRIKGSRTYGYFGGGGFPSALNTIERIDFSNETISSPDNNLSQARYSLEGTSSSSYGYFGGGRNTELSPSYLDTIDRIDFSNETISAPTNNLPQARISLAAVSSSSYGYFGGGSAPSRVATIDRIDFSNETTSAPSNNLPLARTSLAAVSSSSYGYFGGGQAPTESPSRVNTIDRIDFSNETTSPVTATLSQGKNGLAAVSSSSYGYFAGGFAPPYLDTVDRIDFSNETITTPSNNLPEAKTNLAAVSSSSYGYFGGGASGSPLSDYNTDTIDSLDFSNETTSPVTATLSQGRYSPAALSN